MPAVYAHNRFGNLVRERLDEQAREIVEQYPDLYQTGLQGPDFLFFYQPLKKNPVNRRGYQIHEEKASVFMSNGLGVIKDRGICSPEYAYLLGFICHFMLDSECHPFVAREMKRTKTGHIEIESEFEKMLLRTDGKEPLHYPMGDLILTGNRVAAAVAPFYRELPQKTVAEALVEMKRYKTLLASEGAVRRGLLRAGMKLSGHYESLREHLLNEKDNPACEESSQGLYERLLRSVPLTVEIIRDIRGTLEEGKPLSSRFGRNFE